MGIYLGSLPVHKKNVAFIRMMDINAGIVNPQFHVMFENDFRTIQGGNPTPMWKGKAGLLTEREVKLSQRKRDRVPVIIP